MGSPTFAWIWKEIGVKDDPWRPELTIPVRLRGETMIMLRDAKGVPTPPDTSMLHVEEIKLRDIQARIWNYLDDLNVSGDAQKDLLSTIVPAVQGEVQRGVGKLLAVTGKVKGPTQLRAGSRIQNVEVIPATTYKVSFKLQQMGGITKYPTEADIKAAKSTSELLNKSKQVTDNIVGNLYRKDEYGRVAKDKNGVPIREDVSWTKHNVSEVTNWMSQLHWIFGSQANITVELVSVETFQPKTSILPILDKRDQTLDNYKSYINGNADDTVILTGTVYGGWGYSTPLDPGKPWVSFVSDNVIGMPATSNVDKFILLIAHEISHAIMNDRRGGGGTHFCQNGILRSQLSETTIIGDVLRPLLVNRGGSVDEKQVCDTALDRKSKGWN